MFLNILDEEEKEYFLELAIKAAEANNKVEQDEINMLQLFANEMQIPFVKQASKELPEILQYFTDNSSKQTIKIIVFELIGILFADSKLDIEEKDFFNKVCSLLKLEDSLQQEMLNEVREYMDIYKRICRTVLE